MSNLPLSLYRAEQVRKLDQLAIVERDIPGITLMKNAGAAAWHELRAAWPEARRITVVCGSGNNAGDGYILASNALAQQYSVRVMALADPEQLKGDAATAARELLAAGVPVESFSPQNLADCDVIVDALLGTGLDRPVSGAYLEAIAAINRSQRAILSLDIPSGLHADTGQVLGAAVKASITVCFIGLKAGIYTGSGPEYAGQVIFADLNVPPDIYAGIKPRATRLHGSELSRLLAPRMRDAHKGDFGHVLIIGGDYGFAGAVRMAGEAAARSGAGLVSIATRGEHAFALSAAVPELMARGVVEPADLDALLGKVTVIAIGPGLGQSLWGQALLSKVLECRQPLVVDADALNLIAREPFHSDNWILTPHPGEAARLLAISTREVQDDRYGAAAELQRRYGGVIVLKGCGSIIADEAGDLSVCDAGNPGMAAGGMGDVLTGVIAGLLAQGLGKGAAARMGVYLHAHAADAAVAVSGERGLRATDLMPRIQRLANP